MSTTKLAFPWPPRPMRKHKYIGLLKSVLSLLRVAKQNWIPGPGTWSNIHLIVMDKLWRAKWIDWIDVEIELWVAVAVHLPFSVYNLMLFSNRAKSQPKKIRTFWFSAFEFPSYLNYKLYSVTHWYNALIWNHIGFHLNGIKQWKSIERFATSKWLYFFNDPFFIVVLWTWPGKSFQFNRMVGKRQKKTLSELFGVRAIKCEIIYHKLSTISEKSVCFFVFATQKWIGAQRIESCFTHFLYVYFITTLVV